MTDSMTKVLVMDRLWREFQTAVQRDRAILWCVTQHCCDPIEAADALLAARRMGGDLAGVQYMAGADHAAWEAVGGPTTLF